MFYEEIELKHQDEYILITLNKPSKRNAVSLKMINELSEALSHAVKVDNLKFIAITGSGDKAFCSGGDLRDFHGDITEEEARHLLSKMKEVLYRIATFPLPTIALLNGIATGGGCELATACDIRIAREGNEFGFIQGQLGITPGWGGGALLYRRIHANYAFDWLVTSKRLEANTLYSYGWIHMIVPTSRWEDIDYYLKPYLDKSKDQLVAFKKQLLQNINCSTLLTAMNEEVATCSALWDSEEHKNAVKQFFSKKQKK